MNKVALSVWSGKGKVRKIKIRLDRGASVVIRPFCPLKEAMAIVENLVIKEA
jgi:hypothetical protein